MQLTISYQQKVKEVKEAFNRRFPYLKIEFLQTATYTGKFYKVAPNHISLGQITGALREGVMTIRPEDTITKVEQSFLNRFGLPVQIFRSAEDTWIEPTGLDILSLKQQNDIGRSDTQFYRLKAYRYTMLL